MKNNNSQDLSPSDHNNSRVKDNKSKIQSEKVLSSINLKPLNLHALENAERRVWNNLSHSINQHKKTKMPETLSSKTPKISFWDNHKRVILFGGICMLLVLSVSGTSLYWKQKETIDGIGDKVVDKKTTDPKTFDLKSLAAARLNELTGLTVEEYAAVEKASQENTDFSKQPDSNGAASADRQANIPNDAQIQKANFKEIEDIAKKAESGELKISYTKAEITAPQPMATDMYYGSKPNPALGYSGKADPRIDYSKPLISETWSSTNYYKSITSQDSEILNLNVSSPDFSLEYRGGKYAIKTIFEGEQKNYFSGVRYIDDQDPEIQFVKYIIEGNQNIKEIGTATIDGKVLTVFEENYSVIPFDNTVSQPEMAPVNHFIKHYVDLENFKVVLTETYENDTVVSSRKVLISETKKVDDDSEVKSYNEISNVPVKEVTQNISKFNGLPKITDTLKKFPVYYISDLELTIEGIFVNDYYESESYKLYNNADFEPLYDASQLGDPNPFPPTSVNYNQKNISFSIYKENPSGMIEGTGGAPERTLVKEDKTILIDGVETQAVMYSETFQTNIPIDDTDTRKTPVLNTLPDATTVHIVFPGKDGVWYTMTQYAKSMGRIDNGTYELTKTEKISLTSLTEDKAIEIDRYNLEKQDSYPQIQFNTLPLDVIPQNTRLLPGDLEGTFNLTVGTFVTSTRKGSDSNCEKYHIEKFGMDCMLEKYDGFRLIFNDMAGSVNSEVAVGGDMKITENYVYRILEYTVLNIKPSEISDLLKTIESDYTQDYSAMGGPNIRMLYKEIDGKTVIMLSSLNPEELETIMNNVSIDNGYQSLKQKLDAFRTEQEKFQGEPVKIMN